MASAFHFLVSMYFVGKAWQERTLLSSHEHHPSWQTTLTQLVSICDFPECSKVGASSWKARCKADMLQWRKAWFNAFLVFCLISATVHMLKQGI